MSKPLRRACTTALLAGTLLSVFALLAATSADAEDVTVGALHIIGPWARATPGGAKVTAGYVVIRNDGDQPDRLVSVTAEVAGAATIHDMSMQNGVMIMRPLDTGIAIPAHGEITLQPGSAHLMLQDLKQPLKEGESFKGGLTFEKAGTVAVAFTVEAIGAKGPASAKGDDGQMDHMDTGPMDHMKGM